MHDDIKRLEFTGFASDNAAAREHFINAMERQMRDEGYVPSMDNSPQYTVEYLPDEECFYFTLSVYGIFVGEENAWHVSGITDGKRIAGPIRKAKSNPS